MNKLHNLYNQNKIKISYIMCGDPNLETTYKSILKAIDDGMSMIELAIPFSDPTCEEETTKEANIRALKNKLSTNDIFQFVYSIKEQITIPILFVTYANVIFSYGIEQFIKSCRNANIFGLIIKDLPFEEKEEFLTIAQQYEIELISTISKAPKERIAMIAKEASSFINIEGNINDFDYIIKEIKSNTNIPCIVNLNNDNNYHKISKLVDGIATYFNPINI